MFIVPPNCMLPSATSLTMSPVCPSFLCFIPVLLLWQSSTGPHCSAAPAFFDRGRSAADFSRPLVATTAVKAMSAAPPSAASYVHAPLVLALMDARHLS